MEWKEICKVQRGEEQIKLSVPPGNFRGSRSKKWKIFRRKHWKKAPRKGSAVTRLKRLKKKQKPSRKQANQTNTLKKKLKSRFEDIFSNWNDCFIYKGFQEARPSGLDLFSLTQTMPCVERVYYDEQRSTSQLSGI